jgi:hypothetical protein
MAVAMPVPIMVASIDNHHALGANIPMHAIPIPVAANGDLHGLGQDNRLGGRKRGVSKGRTGQQRDGRPTNGVSLCSAPLPE